MPDNKTLPTATNVAAFIDAVEPAVHRADARVLCDMMTRLSGHPPVMWGPSIIGFGHYHYRYDSGREGEMARVGFSPRKAKLVVYLVDGFATRADLLARLGKHATGVSCLYINRLSDIDIGVLERLVTDSLAAMAVRYPEG